jgi:Caspase domain/TIR domain
LFVEHFNVSDNEKDAGGIMAAAANQFSNAFGLVISIAKYQSIRNLPEVSDGQGIAETLVDPNFCGYSNDHVWHLQDASATGEAIRQKLTELAEICNKDSTVFIYFSGHGGQIVSGPNSGAYLLPFDTVNTTSDELRSTAISGDEFTQLMNNIPSRKSFVVFDCCHAGGIGEVKGTAEESGVKPGLSKVFYDGLATGTGRAILASCRADEVSIVLRGAKYGLFTEHFLTGLQGGAGGEDGFIKIFDLFEYLQPRVTATQPGQHPYFKFEGEVNLPIALYRGGRTDQIERSDNEFKYDAYLSYADCEPDSTFVWQSLLPQLAANGLRVAVSYDCEEPGVDRVVSRERGIEKSKRTIVALSESFLKDQWTSFDESIAMALGIEEGKYRILPLKIGPVSNESVPLRLRKLVTLDLTGNATKSEREMQRLVDALRSPIPSRNR